MKLYSHDPSLLQTAINAIHDWSLANHLPLAPEKINVLHLGKRNCNYAYTINNIAIQAPKTIKDLGITIDNKLNFESHINKAVRIAMVRVRQILACFRFTSPEQYVQVFKTYVLPQIEYGSIVYSPPLNSTSCKTLEKPLRLFTRLVCKRCRIPYTSYLDRLDQLKMYPLYL